MEKSVREDRVTKMFNSIDFSTRDTQDELRKWANAKNQLSLGTEREELEYCRVWTLGLELAMVTTRRNQCSRSVTVRSRKMNLIYQFILWQKSLSACGLEMQVFLNMSGTTNQTSQSLLSVCVNDVLVTRLMLFEDTSHVLQGSCVWGI